MATIIQPHDAEWPREFQRVKTHLQFALKDVPIKSIEHVGSTSVPDLWAKPILDISIIVTPEDLAAARRALVQAGYEDRGDLGVPERIAFRQPQASGSSGKNGVPGSIGMKMNTYVVIDGSISLRNHLDLRKVLLEDGELREAYCSVKKGLVDSGVEDEDEYCRGKNEVILNILKRAGWSESDLEEVRKANE